MLIKGTVKCKWYQAFFISYNRKIELSRGPQIFQLNVHSQISSVFFGLEVTPMIAAYKSLITVKDVIFVRVHGQTLNSVYINV